MCVCLSVSVCPDSNIKREFDTKRRDWLRRTSPKWPVLSVSQSVECKTLIILTKMAFDLDIRRADGLCGIAAQLFWPFVARVERACWWRGRSVRRLAGGVDRLLVDVGADVNARDVDGWTPMHAAAHWGQDDACKLLAELRASLSALDLVVSYLPGGVA